MAKFFLNAAGEYFETTREIDVADYPDGRVEVSKRPTNDHQFIAGDWEFVEPAPIEPEPDTWIEAAIKELAKGQPNETAVLAKLRGE